MSETFRTVAGRGRASFEVRGSTFVGHVAPAASIQAAEAVIDEICEAHADATHNVPAYRVRADPLREYQRDADEPSGSAGKPALNVLQGEELENVVAVVARYYGGTKLGVGGLARAYGRAVKLAVEDAGVEARETRPEGESRTARTASPASRERASPASGSPSPSRTTTRAPSGGS